MHTRILALLLVAAAAVACSNEEDQAAKARIFSPEDPPKVLQAAAEPIDAASLAGNGKAIDRVFAISAQEAAARIGDHVQKAKVSFTWTHGDKKVRLKEDRYVALGKGGNFHARVENDKLRGMEWVKVDGVSYARSRYAKFRERRRDRGSSEHVVAEAYATLADFHEILHGAIALQPAGETTLGGRRALRYKVLLGEPRKEERKLPERIFPKGGPDRDTALRLAALEEGKPVALGGLLVVDAEKAVPLQARLEGEVEVEGEDGPSRLLLEVELALEGIGEPAKIEVPKHIEDAPRSPGVVATLKAYGIERAAPEQEKANEDEP